MLHACAIRFVMTKNLKKFLDFSINKQGLNKKPHAKEKKTCSKNQPKRKDQIVKRDILICAFLLPPPSTLRSHVFSSTFFLLSSRTPIQTSQPPKILRKYSTEISSWLRSCSRWSRSLLVHFPLVVTWSRYPLPVLGLHQWGSREFWGDNAGSWRRHWPRRRRPSSTRCWWCARCQCTRSRPAPPAAATSAASGCSRTRSGRAASAWCPAVTAARSGSRTRPRGSSSPPALCCRGSGRAPSRPCSTPPATSCSASRTAGGSTPSSGSALTSATRRSTLTSPSPTTRSTSRGSRRRRPPALAARRLAVARLIYIRPSIADSRWAESTCSLSLSLSLSFIVWLIPFVIASSEW